MHAVWLKVLQSGLARQAGAERIGGSPGSRAALRRFYPYLRRHRAGAIVGGILIGLSTAVGLAPPLVMRRLVDQAILGRELDLVAAAVLTLVLCLTTEKLLRMAHEFRFARFERAVLMDIQSDLIGRVLEHPKAFFDEQQSGYLTRRLTEDVESLRFLFSGTLVGAAGQSLRMAGAIGFLFTLEWRIALAVLALLPLLAFGLQYFSGRIHRLSRVRLESQAAAAGRVQESLAGVAEIKSFAAEERARERIMSALGSVFRIALEQALVHSVSGTLIQAIPGLGRVVALAAGAVLVIRGDLSLGSLVAFQAYLAYVFGPAQYLAAVNLQLQKARAAMERVAALFEIVPEGAGRGGLPVERLNGEIELSGLSFAYPGAEPVLEETSFHIRPGEAVALVGLSGVGKTTLLGLILQFYRPTAGEMLFDGRPAIDYDLKSLRRRMGYVPQTPQLMEGSILDNLRFAEPDAPMERVLAAARAAAVHETILALPDGYRTAVGAGGGSLSEGERQRLALARALVVDPDILVLDEPTSALDPGCEAAVIGSLLALAGRKTVLIVTHRPAIAERCDRLFHLHGRRLVEKHPPAALADDVVQSGVLVS